MLEKKLAEVFVGWGTNNVDGNETPTCVGCIS